MRSLSVSKRLFSTFENYDAASKLYDTTRRAVGVDKIQIALRSMYEDQYAPKGAAKGTPPRSNFRDFLGDLRVLDAGCGTGNYIPPLLEMGVRSIDGLEFNPGMLEQCKAKMRGVEGVTLCHGSILEIPFEPKSFDFVMTNLVLHHLDDDDSIKDDYSKTRTAIQQCFEALHGEGSALYISTSFVTALKSACWEYAAFPSSLSIIEQRYHDFEWWQDRLSAAGFQHVEQHTITEPLMDDEVYFTLENVFEAEWRKTDSTFARVTPEEVEAARTLLQPVIADKAKKKDFVQKYRELLQRHGHTAGIIARK